MRETFLLAQTPWDGAPVPALSVGTQNARELLGGGGNREALAKKRGVLWGTRTTNVYAPDPPNVHR